MRVRRAFPLFVVTVLAVLSASCSPMPDPVTLAHLQIIQQSGSVPADTCTAYVAYEKSKVDGKLPTADGKSLKDITRICSCYADANPQVSAEMDACKTEVLAAIAHERNKAK